MKQTSAASDYEAMSPRLRAELGDAVRDGKLLYSPSPVVSKEAVMFVRPRSESLIFIKLQHGATAGREGDGKLDGIGMSKQLVDYIRSLETI